MTSDAPPPPTRPPQSPRAELLAIVMWWLAIAAGFVAAVVWLAPQRASPPTDGGAIGSTFRPGMDPKTFIASPPVPGRPTRAELDAAIDRGRNAYLHLYVEPSLANAEPGGFLDYTDAEGHKTRLGPNVFVQCQLYLIVHLLMYQDDFGIPRDDPIVQRALAFLVKNFDDSKGRWLWSEEGCLHAKGMTALARFGERDRFAKAWAYARASRMYLPADGLFTMMQSGDIVQTLGAGGRSLSHEDGWEHGGPIIDEENSAKFLFALLTSGRGADDPEVVELRTRLSDFLAHATMGIGTLNAKDVVGRVWEIHDHVLWRLPPDDGYRMALAQMRAAVHGEWRLNFLFRAVPLYRSDLVRALLEAGDENEDIDAIVHGLVASQDPDGAWRLPNTRPLWGLETPPKQGYKYGNIDGSNTYMCTLALIAWRHKVYGS